MRVLLFGGTGNLGSRLIPALLARQHEVVAFVRSPEKLRALIAPALHESITVYKGDAFDSEAVEHAIKNHGCDAIVNTAGNHEPLWREQIMDKIVGSITSAALRVGKERGKPLRAWIIGGLGSLEYPGTGGWKIQDFFQKWMSEHHQQTERIVKSIDTKDLVWSLLCVAIMTPESKAVVLLEQPRGHRLVVSTRSPPAWQDHWVRGIPIVGVYLNLLAGLSSYTTYLEDVADLIAEDLTRGTSSDYVGEFVGFKDVEKNKTA